MSISDDVAAFLARGGQIKVCSPNESAYDTIKIKRNKKGMHRYDNDTDPKLKKNRRGGTR